MQQGHTDSRNQGIKDLRTQQSKDLNKQQTMNQGTKRSMNQGIGEPCPQKSQNPMICIWICIVPISLLGFATGILSLSLLNVSRSNLFNLLRDRRIKHSVCQCSAACAVPSLLLPLSPNRFSLVGRCSAKRTRSALRPQSAAKRFLPAQPRSCASAWSRSPCQRPLDANE